MKVKELIATPQYSRPEGGQRLYFVTETHMEILERLSIELESLFLDIYSNHELNGKRYTIRLKGKSDEIEGDS